MNAETHDSAATGDGARHVRVSCALTLPPEPLDLALDGPITVRLSIQDVTMLDESSTTVAETVVSAPDVSALAGPFALEADLLPGRSYAVYAHLDATGDGSVARGDLITTTRIPVDADAPADVRVVVPVQQVD